MKRPKFQYKSVGRGDPILNGQAIKEYRLAKEITGNALAHFMGFNPSTISYYEHGKRKINEAVFVEYLDAVDTLAAAARSKAKSRG